MSLALFDLDGTLVDQSAASRVWAQEFGETRALDAAQVAEISKRVAERRSQGIVFEGAVA
ncbi:hypothetical protein [Microbacterium sp. NPDC058345]|uniref:hypothetical protein n=1 Tax=Microbacterium sp. NPDC058345 TaxID=3346455 RepID=UPI003654B484